MRVPGVLALLALATTVAAEIHLPPEDCVLMMREARVAAMAGDDATAIARLREAAETWPDELVPLFALLDYHRTHGAADEEVHRLRELLARRLADPEAELPPGTVEYLASAPNVAPEELTLVLEAVTRRLAVRPDDYALLGQAARLQIKLDRTDEAHGTLRAMQALRDDIGVVWTCLALDERAERDDEIAEHLRTLLAASPEAIDLRLRLIETLARAGRFEGMAEQVDRLALEPTDHPSPGDKRILDQLLDVAWQLRDQGDDAQAEAIFRRILAVDADNAPARSAMLHFYSTDEERAAHEAAMRAHWDQESDADALLAEGASLLAGGNAQNAFDLLQRAAAALPRSEIAQFNLGLAAIRLERWEVADTALASACELNPNRAEALFNHGIALVYLKRYPEAIERLDRTVAMRPDLYQAHYYLSLAYRNTGDDERSHAEMDLYDAARGE